MARRKPKACLAGSPRMRLSAGLVALLVAGVVAGCAEPRPDGVEPAPAGEPDDGRTSRPGRGDPDDAGAVADDDWDNATVFTFSEAFDLTVTATTALVGFGSLDGEGCVRFAGAPFRILEGHATVTWAAQTPAAEELSFATWQAYGDYYSDWTYGTSPLEAEIGELPAAEGDSFYTFAVEGGSLASVAYEQEVRLELSLTYEAFEEATVRAGC
jgi:hypothetical protein